MEQSPESRYLAAIRKRIHRLHAAGATLGPIDWRQRLADAVKRGDDPQELAALDFLASQQASDV